MPIDRSQLIADIVFWLPESNVLDEVQLGKVSEYVITQVGDDETKYPEVLCKSLRAAGQANLAKYSVDGAGVKAEKAGGVNVEYNTYVARDVWRNYIDSLKDVCPIFGYHLPVSGGMKISPGKKITVNDCPSTQDLFL